MLARLGESYGKGAKKESARRRSDANAKPGLAIGGGGVWGANGSGAEASGSRKLTAEELGRFGALEEVPAQEGEEDEWDSLYGDTLGLP